MTWRLESKCEDPWSAATGGPGILLLGLYRLKAHTLIQLLIIWPCITQVCTSTSGKEPTFSSTASNNPQAHSETHRLGLGHPVARRHI